jgi:hypothetical protein
VDATGVVSTGVGGAPANVLPVKLSKIIAATTHEAAPKPKK